MDLLHLAFLFYNISVTVILHRFIFEKFIERYCSSYNKDSDTASGFCVYPNTVGTVDDEIDKYIYEQNRLLIFGLCSSLLFFVPLVSLSFLWNLLFSKGLIILAIFGLYISVIGFLFLLSFGRKLKAIHYSLLADIATDVEKLSIAKISRVKLLVGFFLVIEGFFSQIIYYITL